MGNQIQVVKLVIVALVIACLFCVQAEAVTAKARIAPVQGPVPLNVMFTDISEGSPIEWHWDFGDGFTGDGPKIMHTYMSPGTYTVSLLVLDAQGVSDSAVFKDVISVASSPFMPVIPVTVPSFSADFTGGPQSGPAPLTVQFSDLSKGAPASWVWDFGDGSSSTDQNPVHVYTSPGTYSVILKIARDTSSGTKERKNYIKVTAGVQTGQSQVIPTAVPTLVSAEISPGYGEVASESTESSVVMYAEAGEEGCESGLVLDSSSQIIDKGDDILLTITGVPLERIYLWISMEPDAEPVTDGVFPLISDDEMVFDPMEGPYTVGLFVPDMSTGLSIRDLIPDNQSGYSVGYYGMTALDKSGEDVIVLQTNQAATGNYTINAISGDDASGGCIEQLSIQVHP